jgi:heterodisulfide reductase subunit A
MVDHLVDFEDKIEMYTSSEVTGVSGYVGNFIVQITNNSTGQVVDKPVGIIIVATGFKSYKPKDGEYGYNTHKNIITLPDFMKFLNQSEDKGELFYEGNLINKIGFIYCVGSRQKNGDTDKPVNEYCSRYCCNATVFLTTELQKRFPNLYSYHFYQDIRAYGKNEAYYITAREKGALFLKYDPYTPVEVNTSNNDIEVTINDILTQGERIIVPVDLLILVTGMEARDNKKLEEIVKITPGLDGFYKESHPKLKPVETGRMGVLLAGTAQAPRDISETLASASAAAAKAASIVLRGELKLEPAVATVDSNLCENHQKCIPECPTNAIETRNSKSVVNEALCIGCGICTAVCPTEAIQIKTLTSTQIREMIKIMARS